MAWRVVVFRSLGYRPSATGGIKKGRQVPGDKTAGAKKEAAVLNRMAAYICLIPRYDLIAG
ncbi:hypothetical protein DCC81_17310 [Chitinophaga parva]|uniref:Uncharacterized protein n=1 Tax=Chitinophaga parva TaxID=2169414 RepID=A0A2T7BIB9_9BACT|nr:hypothetical protein DCC81_17310 [Chitinophaga parva]